MEFKQITELIELLGKSNLIELKLKDGDFELTLRTENHSLSKNSGKTPAGAGMDTGMIQVPLPPSPQVTTPPDVSDEKSQEDSAENGDYLEIRSPMVGTFYRSSAPDKPPYIKVGDDIQPGAVVCIIEAMKLFNEIESEISGRIAKVMVEDAAPVEYDQVLFLVER